ncbi:MAG: amidohydrolase [Acidobacteriota bacterium]
MTELEQLIRDRRDFHIHPELGYAEHRTSEIIAHRLIEYGYAVRRGVGGTGVVGLAGEETGRTLLYRADMDGLPIREENEVEYASQNAGVMHACGHDAHMAIGLAVARRMAAERLNGCLKFAFQPAEEGGKGAVAMIRDGVMDGVTAAVGLHVWNNLEVGKVGVYRGAMMAAADEFEIVIEGRGGHGAMPEQTTDAIVVASHIVVALQTVVSRNVSPLDSAVVTVGKIEGGSAFNIIAETARLRGTVRSFTEDMHARMPQMIERVVSGVCQSMGASYQLTYDCKTLPLINNREMCEMVASCAAEVVGEENVVADERTMGGEDMSYFLERVPGCFFFLGTRNQSRELVHPHHSPRFDIDESAMEIGVEVMTRVVRRYLNQS